MTHLATFLIVIQAIFSLFSPSELSTLNVNIENGVITKSELTIPYTWTNIVCIGDSNTFWANWFDNSKRWCDLIATNTGYTIYNAWVSSSTATDLIGRNATDVYPRKVNGKRNIVTILVGTNDWYYNHTVEQTWTDIKTVITQLKSNGWEVIVLTYPPSVGNSSRNIFLRSLNSLILTNSSVMGYRTVDSYIDIVDPLNQDNAKSGMIGSDNLHLTEQGHLAIYNKVAGIFGFTWTTIPTQTGSTSTGTYAVVSTTDKAPEIVVNGNTITNTVNAWKSVRATVWKSSWKWYWEVQNNTTGNKFWIRGIGKSTANINSYLWVDASGYAWYNDWTSSLKWNNWVNPNYGSLSNSGDIIGFALDMDAGTLTAYKNWVSQWIMYTGLVWTYFPMFSVYWAWPSMTVNFGNTPFSYSVVWFNPITN
jgi:lysophospholipase L1-like esterase